MCVCVCVPLSRSVLFARSLSFTLSLSFARSPSVALSFSHALSISLPRVLARARALSPYRFLHLSLCPLQFKVQRLSENEQLNKEMEALVVELERVNWCLVDKDQTIETVCMSVVCM